MRVLQEDCIGICRCSRKDIILQEETEPYEKSSYSCPACGKEFLIFLDPVHGRFMAANKEFISIAERKT